MSILDLLLSLPGAPDGGVGLGPGLGGGTPAAGGSSPPACMGGPAGGTDGNGDGDGGADDGQRRRGLGFFTGDPNDLKTKQFLQRYAKWMNKGTTAERAVKSFTGLLVIPLTAPVMCLENSVRSPGLGSSR